MEKCITQQRKENTKTLFEKNRADMMRIEQNYGNKAKCCSLCVKSETTKYFQCEESQDTITEEMYVKIIENIDKENPEIIRCLAEPFRTVLKTRGI